MDDPWNWDVDRVVRELCSNNRSWEPPSAPLKFPPLTQLEASLREEEVDGHTLLTYDHEQLCTGLGFKILKHKATLKHAIGVFRSRSQQYRLTQKRDFSEFDADNNQQQVGKEAGGNGSPSQLSALGGVGLDGGWKKMERGLTMASSNSHDNRQTGFTSAPDQVQSSVSPSSAQKKRRLVPMLVSTDINVNVTRNIPTEADVILAPRSQGTHTNAANISRTNNDAFHLASEYLGQDAFTRIDIDDYGLSHEDGSLQFSTISPSAPSGRRLQVHRLIKRRLIRRSKARKPYVMKPDMVPGANDPDHDEVLPLFGESDGECDSETWEEAEAERIENEQAQSRPGLSHDEVQIIIDDSIQEFAADWKQRKCTKLVKKANKFWVDARKSGLKRSLAKNRGNLDALKARIAKYAEEMAIQTWHDEAELRESTAILQQSVEDREYFSWVLNVIAAPNEPEKFPSLPRRVAGKARRLKPISKDEEILTSESEEEIGNFIVNDEPSPPVAPSIGSPMSISDDDVDMQAQLDESYSLNPPKTPAKLHEIIDLITPEKSCLGAASANTPEAAAEFDEIEPHSPESKSRTLEFGIDDLEPTQQMVANGLAKYDARYVSLIFTLARGMEPRQIWLDVILRMLNKSEVIPKIETIHPQELECIRLASSIFRLFEMYRDGIFYSIGRYKNMSYEDRAEKKAATERSLDRFDDFVYFLRRLSDRFEWQEEWIPAIERRVKQERPEEADEELQSEGTKRTTPGVPDHDIAFDGSSSSDDTQISSEPAGKKKRTGKREIRIQAAEAMREAEKERSKTVAHRRDLQRAKIQVLTKSGVIKLDSQQDKIINESKEDDQGFIYIHPDIAPRIKEHQVEGVRFMWNQIVGSSARQGCLLAHTMGLGKTMQIVTLLVAIAEAANSEDPTISSQVPDKLKKSKTLIVCPPSLVENWLDELLFWAPETHKLGDFFRIESSSPPSTRIGHILNWNNRGGVLIIGYSLFVKAFKSEEIRNILTDSPNLVVADEAHELKNEKTKTHLAAAHFKTHSRIALTGTPLANKVEEYYAMINWIAPKYLSDKRDFMSQYATPIQEGLKGNRGLKGLKHALKMLRVVKQEVAPKMQRVTISVLKDDIPPKQEFVLIVPLTPLQRELYETFVKYHKEHTLKSATLMSAHTLGLICAHPCIFKAKLKANREVILNKDEQQGLLPTKLVIDQLTILRKEKDLNAAALSGKILLLMSLLEECRRIGDPVVLFSQSMQVLDYLEQILRQKKFSLLRLDGKTNMDIRQNMVKEFNKSMINIFLISTKAGGQGFNIVGANRVVIFDSRFNPQDEQQAVGRAYRIGQKKPVSVYRFICGGTIEEQALNLQIWKMQLASRVVDKKNPINRLVGLDQSLQMPLEPEQHDLDGYVGKDSVLDKVIEKHRSGIRAIMMTDTFEEEELESAHLTPEDIAEADSLIAQNEARRLGKPILPPTGHKAGSLVVPAGFRPGPPTGFQSNLPTGIPTDYTANAPVVPASLQSLQPGPPPPFRVTSTPLLGFQLPPPPPPSSPKPRASVESQTHSVTDDTQGSLRTTTNEGNIESSKTVERPLNSDLVNRRDSLYPIQDAMLHTQNQFPGRTLIHEDMVWEKQSAFNGELARLFSKNATPTESDQDMGRKVASRVTAEVWGRQPEVQGGVKQAIIDAASSPRFVQGICMGFLPVEDLATMEPGDIARQRATWEEMAEEDWNAMKPPRQAKVNPDDHRQDALHKPPSTPRNEDHRSGQHKSHRLDDQKALEAVMERRKAKSSSHGKNPRLPSWAVTAVATRGRSTSTSPSAASPAATSRQPRHPFH
ncbi:actin-like protein arp8 [Hypoxylon texense]